MGSMGLLRDRDRHAHGLIGPRDQVETDPHDGAKAKKRHGARNQEPRADVEYRGLARAGHAPNFVIDAGLNVHEHTRFFHPARPDRLFLTGDGPPPNLAPISTEDAAYADRAAVLADR